MKTNFLATLFLLCFSPGMAIGESAFDKFDFSSARQDVELAPVVENNLDPTEQYPRDLVAMESAAVDWLTSSFAMVSADDYFGVRDFSKILGRPYGIMFTFGESGQERTSLYTIELECLKNYPPSVCDGAIVSFLAEQRRVIVEQARVLQDSIAPENMEEISRKADFLVYKVLDLIDSQKNSEEWCSGTSEKAGTRSYIRGELNRVLGRFKENLLKLTSHDPVQKIFNEEVGTASSNEQFERTFEQCFSHKAELQNSVLRFMERIEKNCYVKSERKEFHVTLIEELVKLARQRREDTEVVTHSFNTLNERYKISEEHTDPISYLQSVAQERTEKFMPLLQEALSSADPELLSLALVFYSGSTPSQVDLFESNTLFTQTAYRVLNESPLGFTRFHLERSLSPQFGEEGSLGLQGFGAAPQQTGQEEGPQGYGAFAVKLDMNKVDSFLRHSIRSRRRNHNNSVALVPIKPEYYGSAQVKDELGYTQTRQPLKERDLNSYPPFIGTLFSSDGLEDFENPVEVTKVVNENGSYTLLGDDPHYRSWTAGREETHKLGSPQQFVAYYFFNSDCDLDRTYEIIFKQAPISATNERLGLNGVGYLEKKSQPYTFAYFLHDGRMAGLLEYYLNKTRNTKLDDQHSVLDVTQSERLFFNKEVFDSDYKLKVLLGDSLRTLVFPSDLHVNFKYSCSGSTRVEKTEYEKEPFKILDGGPFIAVQDRGRGVTRSVEIPSNCKQEAQIHEADKQLFDPLPRVHCDYNPKACKTIQLDHELIEQMRARYQDGSVKFGQPQTILYDHLVRGSSVPVLN